MKKHEIYSLPISGRGEKRFLIVNLTLLLFLAGFMQVRGNDKFPGNKDPNTTTVESVTV